MRATAAERPSIRDERPRGGGGKTMSDEAKIPEWKRFPVFDELLADPAKCAEMKRRILATCQDLDAVLRDGSPEEQTAAQGALNAFVHARLVLERAERALAQVRK